MSIYSGFLKNLLEIVQILKNWFELIIEKLNEWKEDLEPFWKPFPHKCHDIRHMEKQVDNYLARLNHRYLISWTWVTLIFSNNYFSEQIDLMETGTEGDGNYIK